MSDSGRPAPIDYGIDAPGVRLGMASIGIIGIASTIGGVAFVPGMPAWKPWLLAFGLLATTYGCFMAGYMTWGSRVGKLRARDRLLQLVGELRPWIGTEAVLDVGCGRGLMLIGAARLLSTGTAVGIDLWRGEDQAGNSPQSAVENARKAGVSARVRIDTGDARHLPYPDASFDVVTTHWVVHNLSDAADRARAIDEMLRVLRPGGVLVLADIANVPDYANHLRSRGVGSIRFVDGGLEARVMGLLSGGSYKPQALLARV